VVAVKAKNPGDIGIVKMILQRSPCMGAHLIPGPSTQMGDNTASPNNFSLSCGGTGGPDDLWYLISCPSSTTLHAETCGTTFDTVLGVKQGSCRGPEAACNDDFCGMQSTVDVALPKPGLWFIVMDGYGATDRGPYQLAVSW
jgi:hypothetical protein